MNLYLLRHGLAVEQTIPSFKLDSDRPLTPEGRKKTERTPPSIMNPGFIARPKMPPPRLKLTPERT